MYCIDTAVILVVSIVISGADAARDRSISISISGRNASWNAYLLHDRPSVGEA